VTRLARAALLLSFILVIAVIAPGRAHARELTDRDLVLTGFGMSVPAFFVGVTLHEGTHALLAHSFGAEIVEIRLTPGFYEGRFYFGLTRWKGQLTRGERTITLLGPKGVDLVIMGGFTAMWLTDSLPASDLGTLALTVLATGSWVDFTKDVFSRNPGNDTVQVYRLYGKKSEWQRLPYRLAQVGLSAAGGYFIARSYQDLFGDEEVAATAPLIFQVTSGSF
jgi:hypothetical protein